MKHKTNLILYFLLVSLSTGVNAMSELSKIKFETSDGILLSADLSQPGRDSTQKRPAILIVEGSGKSPTEIESSTSPFKQLASKLSEHGYIVLKYNKRGSGENTKNGSFWKSTFTIDNQDAQAALDFLLKRKDVDQNNVFLIGHSFGGPHCLQLSLKNKIKGVVMLTSTILPVDQLLIEQNQMILELMGQPKKVIDEEVIKIKRQTSQIREKKFKCLEQECSFIDGVEVLDKSIQVPWLAEVLKIDFADIAKKTKSDILFLYGSSDPIIPETDYNTAVKIFKDNSRIRIKKIPKLDHFMMNVDSKKDSLAAAKKAQKENAFQTISLSLVDEILNWLKECSQ